MSQITSDRTYMIICCQGDMNMVVPPGATDSFPGEPLRCMPGSPMPPVVVRCERVGGDRYKIYAMRTPGHCIGTLRNGPPELRFVPQSREHECQTEWAIEPSGEGNFRVHSPERDSCWTFTGGPGGVVVLERSQGMAGQEWKFMPVLE